MQKKVLFVNLRLSVGGSEKVMALLANSYAEHGVETEMLLLKDDEKTYHISKKVKLIECYCQRGKSNILWHIRRVLSIRKAVKKSDADTVISFMWDMNMNVLLACIGLHKYIIVSERADPHNEVRKKAFNFASKWILPMADITVFQTPQVQAYYPINIRKRSVVIPNPISSTIPTPYEGKRERLIVAAGRFSEQKNFNMLLKAFAQFYLNHFDYKLTIYGDGPLREELQMQAKILNIDSVVSFPGFVQNVNSKMRNAAIYASSSNYEGISNSILEALAMGIPSVCTNCPVGGTAMVIQDGENGLLVPVGDVSKMAEAFARIADSPELANHLSNNAVESCKRYALEIIFKKWSRL